MTGSMLIATKRWRYDHPGSRASVVVYEDCVAGADGAPLNGLKRSLEQEIRARWGSADKQALLADPTLAAYQAHDRRFGQNYHVAMQIRSIAQGKALPDRNPLIEAMFMTELKTGVLAAAHDRDLIALPIVVDSADGTEGYTRYDGMEERCKSGDQLMRDAAGMVLTSIAQGPTSFGLVTDNTRSVAYCFYFPAGVTDAVIAGSLAYLDTCVAAACPGARQVGQETVSAG